MLLLQKPLDRYFLPAIPLLIFAWRQMLMAINRRLSPKWGDRVVLALLIFGCSTNLARLGEIVVEQRRVPFLDHYHDGRYASARDVASVVNQHLGPHDWLMVEPKVARIMTFLSRRNAVEL